MERSKFQSFNTFDVLNATRERRREGGREREIFCTYVYITSSLWKCLIENMALRVTLHKVGYSFLSPIKHGKKQMHGNDSSFLHCQKQCLLTRFVRQ